MIDVMFNFKVSVWSLEMFSSEQFELEPWMICLQFHWADSFSAAMSGPSAGVHNVNM